ncbi:hypothetical protein [Streptomyces nodosus]|uniref:hypothetical protein n=1 Tax=Streptomyces nodosus TaxID=40318 RepID=UPI00382AD446
MNTPKRTRALRGGEAILGARAARQRTRFVRIMAAQLDQIAPGTIRVHTAPTWIVLESATGPIDADRDAHRAAYGLLQRAFPSADWTRPRTYDARTGLLAVDSPTVPAELGIDTAEAGQ